MTVRELSQLYWLNREIERYEARLAELRSRAEYPSVRCGNGGRSEPSDRVGRYVAESEHLRKRLERALRRREKERTRLLDFIAAIPDSLTRQIVLLRFHDGLSWRRAADSLGGGNTPQGVRLRVFRALRNL